VNPLLSQAAAFGKTIQQAKRALTVDFEWYPYDTISALWHIDKLLAPQHRDVLAPRGARVLDFGSQDGELAFFLESLGFEVVAADHPAYNHNGMRGIRALKAALGSHIAIHEIDADRPFTLPHDSYDLVLFLGILYHLRNPFYVLEELARRATHLMLSTRIARAYPGGAPMPRDLAIAYLLRENELNLDDSNYFIFSEPALRVLLERTHWEVRDFLTLGGAGASDPIRADRDERAFCYARSRHERLANVELLRGWHDSEDTGWRWTERVFAARVHGGKTLTMRFYIAEESIRRLGRLTLSATADGRPLASAVYDTPGPASYVRELAGEAGDVTVEFTLDGALEPEESDSRQRGIIVAAIEVA
jgi:2-polyprenyl-3-methyl-5-hydroxy-6-metoxy-1,4-benzoquinol methylase